MSDSQYARPAAGGEDFAMSNEIRVGRAASSGLLTAIVAVALASCQAGSSGPIRTPAVTMTAEPTASPIPRLNGQDPLSPGRYQVNASIPAIVTVEVPSGWVAGGDWVVAGPATDPDNGITIRFYTIPNIAVDPLSPAAGNLDPPVGPTVDDLVQAIVAHPAWTASEPTEITIDGRDGQLVTIRIPLDAPLPADSEGEFYFYADPAGGGIWGWLPGQTFDWYIVDVDGQRLIIDAFHYPDASPEDLAAQRAVVESVQFGS
jgi:hypothetical protein